MTVQMLRTQDVAEQLKMSPRSVQRMAKAGILPQPLRIGKRSVRWSRQAIEEYLANLGGSADRGAAHSL